MFGLISLHWYWLNDQKENSLYSKTFWVPKGWKIAPTVSEIFFFWSIGAKGKLAVALKLPGIWFWTSYFSEVRLTTKFLAGEVLQIYCKCPLEIGEKILAFSASRTGAKKCWKVSTSIDFWQLWKHLSFDLESKNFSKFIMFDQTSAKSLTSMVANYQTQKCSLVTSYTNIYI